MGYRAPLREMLFVLRELADLPGISRLPGQEEHGMDTAAAVLDECARLCEAVIAPLNAPGDRQPARWQHGEVVTSPGFRAAYRQFAEGGWQGLGHPAAEGGQGLPRVIAAACAEMLQASSMAFGLCPMLTDGAIEALRIAADPALRARYLPPLVAGRWSGAMDLTEPQAGSDLAAVSTRAEPQPDGSYRLFGGKIFITYGEHDLTENIVHLVLARITGAPQGVGGISLFVVPKFRVLPDGSLGDRNDVHCVGIEHKLGIHASPTATLRFGDREGAFGERVGAPNQGLRTMFIMINAARFAVGLQGVGLCDRAFQLARAHALERVQGRAPEGGPEPVVIARHPDVRRMLLTMKASTEAARALAYCAAAAGDRARHAPDPTERSRQQALHEFLVPIVKGHGTELAVEVASLGLQVHGGSGYIEETGAAQHYRDARILPIYEGTTAIQANDLVGRKTLRDGGTVARRLCADIADTEAALLAGGTPDCRVMADALRAGRLALASAVDFMLAQGTARPAAVHAGAVPYLRLAGLVLGGWQMARALLAALRCEAEDPAFSRARIATARFYAESLLPQAGALQAVVLHGGDTVAGLDIALL